ncbi:CHAD domain-containing protein [Streptomyces sp. NPDC000410]|uniref:CHAD domain-containing protein n=1 Tax=Streptomyces sp. NPDC000410 TaxID=3154254 RepID=UPI00332B5D76
MPGTGARADSARSDNAAGLGREASATADVTSGSGAGIAPAAQAARSGPADDRTSLSAPGTEPAAPGAPPRRAGREAGGSRPLKDAAARPAGRGARAAGGATPQAAARGALTVGAARAAALLERQLTLGRTRAHSAALQALGSSRFHAVADAVALLASEVPLAAAAAAPAAVLDTHAETVERRLLDAVTALPLARAAHPYNAEALVHGLATASAGEAQDAPWHQVRLLLRLHRYAQEVRAAGRDPLLTVAGQTLDRHRDAAEAAGAAAAAARTPRIAPATAYALGVLHADQRHEVEAARFAFHHVWHRQAVAAP